MSGVRDRRFGRTRRVARALASVAAAALLVVPAAPAHADVEDFTFSSLEVDAYLARDASGASGVVIVEHWVAEFPDIDQNRGIIRDLPTRDGAKDLGLVVIDITDEHGAEIPWSRGGDAPAGTERLVIDDDTFKHGATHYVIRYGMSDIIRSFDDGDEYFANVNGTGWAQPIRQVTARLHVAGGDTPGAAAGPYAGPLDAALDGRAACYTGEYGSSASDCTVEAPASGPADWPATDWTPSPPPTETVIETRAGPLAAHENLSFVVGFEPGTFRQPDPPAEVAVGWTAVGTGLTAVLVALITMLGTRWRDRRSLPQPRIVQYTAPKGVPLRVSAVVYDAVARLVPAVVTELVVRDLVELRIRKGAPRTTKPGDYTLVRLVSGKVSAKAQAAEQRAGGTEDAGGRGTRDWPDGADEYDKALIAALFGRGKNPQSKFRLDQASAARAKRIRTYRTRSIELASEFGFVARHRTWLNWTLAIAMFIAVVAAITALFLAIDGFIPLWVGVVGLILTAAGFIGSVALRPSTYELSESGRELFQYLEGMREYIRVAEAERLRMLQSPTTAETRTVGTIHPSEVAASDPDELRLHVYERMLPYAVLFKQEKQWGQVLAQVGAEIPDASAHADLVRAASNGALASMIAAGVSSPSSSGSGGGSSSYSSGFSSGGGFSGGGFGGGGGGGR